MDAKDTVMLYEEARALDDAIERQYKKERGYDRMGINWAYTYEDRQAIESKVKWGKLEKQAEISFKAGIKEVVEWVNQFWCSDIPDSMDALELTPRKWQAKLKEWKIEGINRRE
jgi:hypothetical protein